jgi:hypothetical protein
LDFHGHVVFFVPVFVSVEDLSYEPCCYSDVVVHFRNKLGMRIGLFEGVSSLKVISPEPQVMWRFESGQVGVEPLNFQKFFLSRIKSEIQYVFGGSLLIEV